MTMPVLSPARPATVRSTTSEQLAPVLRVQDELMQTCTPVVDAEAGRRRIARGNVAYDALRVLRTCGELTTRFARVLEAFEVAGFLSNNDRRALIHSEYDVDD